MTKAPHAGLVKTRLQPPLTAEEAAALNVCFLRDTAAAITRAGAGTTGLAIYTPIGSEAQYKDILPKTFLLLPQRGEDFGERLANAMEDIFSVGFPACCLTDSDSPTVGPQVFSAAAAALRDPGTDLVVGPCQDGGYYLIGMRKLHLPLFKNIDWSTERVFEQTMTRAQALNLSVRVLPKSFDVDDAESLRRLRDELLGDQRETAPATKAFLVQLMKRETRDRIWSE